MPHGKRPAYAERRLPRRFTYAPGRHGRGAMDILTGFVGILQVDGYTGYDALAGRSKSRQAESSARFRHRFRWFMPTEDTGSRRLPA